MENQQYSYRQKNNLHAITIAVILTKSNQSIEAIHKLLYKPEMAAFSASISARFLAINLSSDESGAAICPNNLSSYCSNCLAKPSFGLAKALASRTYVCLM